MKYFNPNLRYALINFFSDIGIRGSGIIARLASNVLIPSPKEDMIVETVHGFKIKVDPLIDNGVERNIYRFGTYEKGTLSVLDMCLEEGDTFVDVGANIGLMSIYAALRVRDKGLVMAFEANPITKSILDDNLSLNRLSNVKSYGFALGSTESTAKIYTNLNINRGSASLNKLDERSESFDIEIKRFETFAPAGRKIKMMKIDVEGWEMEVLTGCGLLLSQPDSPALIVECSDVVHNGTANVTSKLFNTIKSLNDYKVFKLKRGKENVSRLVEVKGEKDLPEHDNLFCFLPNQLKALPKKRFHQHQ